MARHSPSKRRAFSRTPYARPSTWFSIQPHRARLRPRFRLGEFAKLRGPKSRRSRRRQLRADVRGRAPLRRAEQSRPPSFLPSLSKSRLACFRPRISKHSSFGGFVGFQGVTSLKAPSAPVMILQIFSLASARRARRPRRRVMIVQRHGGTLALGFGFPKEKSAFAGGRYLP
jgi:hypothetical protein